MQEAAIGDTNASAECKFYCTNGKCLNLGSLICNQLNNCGDNSDEENCPGLTPRPPPGIFSSELEFVQIIIIIVVMTVMVVVIICLLNLYKFSSWAFISRYSQGRRRETTLQQNTCTWPTDNMMPQHRGSETLYSQRNRDRLTAPAFTPRDPFSRFQPTYPYLQQEIDLPPTISLSDGEEPPPYQGPCKLQLRDPEQQMELNRESVRAPPNRTVYDSELMDVPRPPSSNTGTSGAHTCMEGPPPPYSQVVGHDRSSSHLLHQHSNKPASRTALLTGESTILKAKDIRRDKLV